MAQFHWNYIHPTGNLQKAYEQYLQNTEYVKDITDCINYNSNGIKSILESNNININNVNSGIKSICGRLDRGFEMMESYLISIDIGIQNLSSEISNMSSLLDWKLSVLIEEQRITNRLLGNIASIMKIPDAQKERVYYIEEGLKYLKNALIENSNSDFFEEAYTSFHEALRRENKDYVSLNRIGFIHLFSSEYLDFSKSEEYFRKSIRYSTAEANVGGTNTSNTLNPFISDFNLNDNIHLISSMESMLYCARACALQNKLDEAIELTTSAYSKIPSFLTAGYETAKYYCLNNQVDKALTYIEDIIEKDRYQSLKIIADPDIIKHNEVISKLEQIRNKYIEKAKNLGKSIEELIHNDSVFFPLFKKHQELINENTLLSARESIDIVSNKYIWSYLSFYEIEPNYNNNYQDGIRKIIKTHNDIYSTKYPLGVYRITRNHDKENIEEELIYASNNDNRLAIPSDFLNIESENFKNFDKIYNSIKERRIAKAIEKRKSEISSQTMLFSAIAFGIWGLNLTSDHMGNGFFNSLWVIIKYFIGLILVGVFVGRFISSILELQVNRNNVKYEEIKVDF